MALLLLAVGAGGGGSQSVTLSSRMNSFLQQGWQGLVEYEGWRIEPQGVLCDTYVKPLLAQRRGTPGPNSAQ